MEIYVNHKLAMLKKGTSFEYVAENRLFSGSDGYTLTITFPLRGCKRNLDIFGHINRKDVVAGKVIFDCEIRDKGFYKFGSITITEISDAEVKTQFLEGRSEQNFDETFDDIYINELDLGSPPTTSKSARKPTEAWSPYPNISSPECVALPTNATSPYARASPFTPLDNSSSRDNETVEEGEFFAADVEGIDHEVASTEWEKTRLCRPCGV